MIESYCSCKVVPNYLTIQIHNIEPMRERKVAVCKTGEKKKLKLSIFIFYFFFHQQI